LTFYKTKKSIPEKGMDFVLYVTTIGLPRHPEKAPL